MKSNPASEGVKKTAICVGVFYLVRRFLLWRYEEKYSGFWGGFRALGDLDQVQFEDRLIQIATIVYAIAWMVLLYGIGCWVYNEWFAAPKPEEKLPPKLEN